jgi:hypothetical protein
MDPTNAPPIQQPLSAEVPPDTVPYRLVPAEGYNMHTAIFNVPVGLEAVLASNVVNARGSSFEFVVGSTPGTICSTFNSSDPKATADAIGVRLKARIGDPSPPGAEACVIM